MKILVNLASIATLTLAVGQLSSAGTNDESLLSIATTPSMDAPILMSAGSSCTDIATFARSGSTLATSVAPYRIDYAGLSLAWLGKNPLYVTSIKAVLTGDKLMGQTQTMDFSQDEIAALLGNSAKMIPGQGMINTNDSNSRSTMEFPPCGLEIGGVQFMANVTEAVVDVRIEISGYTKEFFGKHDVQAHFRTSAIYQQ